MVHWVTCLYFYSFKNPGLVVDIVQDIRAMNSEAVHAGPRKTGMIILGGGLPKHHICNANMMRNGADYACLLTLHRSLTGVIQVLVQMKLCPGAKFEVLPRQLRFTVMQPLLSLYSSLKRFAQRKGFAETS
ncbi:deoxyhypusine synthase-like [Salvia miltiorrhiza]|uniref:deoxyhypusine synthase-like n=1 Tax=Salvia miltiorrhiza TaxID=226208 RepID=UPI0025ACEC6D|nr:deoxyhypusine synthase-like [Salvia miltiorrhiza]